MNLKDIIKVNQLVRRGVDLEEFKAWYAKLTAKEQNELIACLHEFAYQAGVGDDTWLEALFSVGPNGNFDLVQDIKSFHLDEIGLHDSAGFNEWLKHRSDDERYTTFLITVNLFGVAEGRVFRSEVVDCCNHWWHRDLLDPRVVEAILGDPNFYQTSMKDDKAIKTQARPVDPPVA